MIGPRCPFRLLRMQSDCVILRTFPPGIRRLVALVSEPDVTGPEAEVRNLTYGGGPDLLVYEDSPWVKAGDLDQRFRFWRGLRAYPDLIGSIPILLEARGLRNVDEPGLYAMVD